MWTSARKAYKKISLPSFSPPRHATKLKLQYNVSSCFIDKSKNNNFINSKYLQIIYDYDKAPSSINSTL